MPDPPISLLFIVRFRIYGAIYVPTKLQIKEEGRPPPVVLSLSICVFTFFLARAAYVNPAQLASKEQRPRLYDVVLAAHSEFL